METDGISSDFPVLLTRVRVLLDREAIGHTCSLCTLAPTHHFEIFIDERLFSERHPDAALYAWRQTLKEQLSHGPYPHLVDHFCFQHGYNTLGRPGEFYLRLFLQRTDRQAGILFKRSGFPNEMRVSLVPDTLSYLEIVASIFAQPRENDRLMSTPPGFREQDTF